ncbi:MAG: head GIN domain-containing protein [Bacteroidota bacterium]
MNKSLFNLSLLACAFIFFSGCSSDDFNGSDNIISITRSLASFDKIVAENALTVNVIEGNTQNVEIQVNENLQDQIRTQVSNGTLTISLERGSYRNATFEVYIQLPDLERLQLDDATEGEIVFDLDQLELELNGSAKLDLSGSAQTLTINNNNAGEIDGFSFTTATLNVEARDAAELEITCTNTLNGSVQNAAEVRYRGIPDVNATTSDAGKIINAN